MRFERSDRALDKLADALRRAELTWQWEGVPAWNAIPETEQEEWRRLARLAAGSVCEEVTPAKRRVAAE
jgi:hypothetical protein